jgi:hypothetical protein
MPRKGFGVRRGLRLQIGNKTCKQFSNRWIVILSESMAYEMVRPILSWAPYRRSRTSVNVVNNLKIKELRPDCRSRASGGVRWCPQKTLVYLLVCGRDQQNRCQHSPNNRAQGLRRLLRVIAGYDGGPETLAALRLLPLTLVRPGRASRGG